MQRRKSILVVGNEDVFIEFMGHYAADTYELVFASDWLEVGKESEGRDLALAVVDLDELGHNPGALTALSDKSDALLGVAQEPDRHKGKLETILDPEDPDEVIAASNLMLEERRRHPRVEHELPLTLSGAAVMATAISPVSIFVPSATKLPVGQKVQLGVRWGQETLTCQVEVARAGNGGNGDPGMALAVPAHATKIRELLNRLVQRSLLVDHCQQSGLHFLPKPKVQTKLADRAEKLLFEEERKAPSTEAPPVSAQAPRPDSAFLRLKDEIEGQKKHIRRLEQRLEQGESGRKELKQALQARSAMEEQLGAASKTQQRLEQALEAQAEQIAGLRDQLESSGSAKEQDLKQALAARSELESELKNSQAAQLKLEQDLRRQGGQIRNLKEGMEERSWDKAEDDAVRESLLEQQKQLQSMKEQLNQRSGADQQMSQELAQQLSAARQEISALKEGLSQVQTSRHRLKEELAQQAELIHQLQLLRAPAEESAQSATEVKPEQSIEAAMKPLPAKPVTKPPPLKPPPLNPEDEAAKPAGSTSAEAPASQEPVQSAAAPRGDLTTLGVGGDPAVVEATTPRRAAATMLGVGQVSASIPAHGSTVERPTAGAIVAKGLAVEPQAGVDNEDADEVTAARKPDPALLGSKTAPAAAIALGDLLPAPVVSGQPKEEEEETLVESGVPPGMAPLPWQPGGQLAPEPEEEEADADFNENPTVEYDRAYPGGGLPPPVQASMAEPAPELPLEETVNEGAGGVGQRMVTSEQQLAGSVEQQMVGGVEEVEPRPIAGQDMPLELEQQATGFKFGPRAYLILGGGLLVGLAIVVTVAMLLGGDEQVTADPQQTVAAVAADADLAVAPPADLGQTNPDSAPTQVPDAATAVALSADAAAVDSAPQPDAKAKPKPKLSPRQRRQQRYRNHLNMARVHLRKGRSKLARKHLTYALRIRDSARVRSMMASSHRKDGELWPAVHHLRKALGLSRRKASLQLRLGQIYLKLGKRTHACAALKQAQKLNRAKKLLSKCN